MKKEILMMLAKKEIELNKLINQENSPENIGEQYMSFFALSQLVTNETEQFLGSDKNDIVSWHDSYIENYSAKKQGNMFNTTFDTYLNLYEKQEGEMASEVGYFKAKFTIQTKEKLRSISNKDIYRFWIDKHNKELLFITRYRGNLKIHHMNYESLFLEKSEAIYYKSKQPGFLELN